MNTSIGQQLRGKREEQGLTIEQVSSSTKIRAHYLRAIESGEWGVFPSAVHGRGFLRAYAEFLGLDVEARIGEVEGVAAPPVLPPKSPPEPEASETPQDVQQDAEEIFLDIGQQLQRQRELLGLTLEDIERHTHLRQHYLKALETGDLDGLPSPVQGRGMLNNYANFIGLNADLLLLQFADGLQAQLRARRAVQPKPPKSSSHKKEVSPPSKIRQLLSPDILIGGSLVLFLSIFIVWGVIRIFTMTSDTAASPTAPSIAELLLATSTPSATLTPQPTAPTPLPQSGLFPTQPFPIATPEDGGPMPAGSRAAVQVYLTILQRAWMRVLVDGKIEFEGRVIPGSAYPFVGESQVEILTGNGDAIQVFYNGVDLGTLGDIGEIVNLVFTPMGAFPPTPTITATLSSTPPITPTSPSDQASTPEAVTPPANP